jgi:hypothetical protein
LISQSRGLGDVYKRQVDYRVESRDESIKHKE